MRFGESELKKIFRAAILSATAPALTCAWTACSPSDTPGDGGTDATTSDVTDGGISFGDVALDSYVNWCEAGPPTFVTQDPTQCFAYLSVPCGLPSNIGYLDIDAGRLARCDLVCKGYGEYDCYVLNDAQVATILATLDAGDAATDAADDADAAATDGGVVEAGPGVYVECDCYNGGRRHAGYRMRRAKRVGAVGGYFADMARLEGASVFAFRRLVAELRALGAPPALIARALRSVVDEERHARTVSRIAKRFGTLATMPRAPRFRGRGVERIATENIVEGCVRETYGALVATWQATHAEDPRVRRAMRSIASDETRHAALSLSVASFVSTKLDARSRARVAHAKRRAIDDLRKSAAIDPHPDLVRVAGLPPSAHARSLVDALARDIWNPGAQR